MSTTQITGTNYSFDGMTIDFFGSKGVVLNDSRWAINVFGENGFVSMPPISIMENVRFCINSDVKSGCADQLAQLQIDAASAVIFFLEGGFTADHLKNAVEADSFIDIPDIEVEGYKLTVRVAANPEYTVVTADREGNVI